MVVKEKVGTVMDFIFAFVRIDDQPSQYSIQAVDMRTASAHVVRPSKGLNKVSQKGRRKPGFIICILHPRRGCITVRSWAEHKGLCVYWEYTACPRYEHWLTKGG